jgi:GlpG protein
MRLIKVFEKEDLAKAFSSFLQKEGVRSFLDVEIDDESKQFFYQVWVLDEDQKTKAQNLLLDFEKVGFQPAFENVVFQKSSEEMSQKPSSPGPVLRFKRTFHSHTLTTFLLFLCVGIYFLNFYQELQIRRNDPRQTFVLLTPVIYWMLFDVPYVLIEYDALVKEYKVDPKKKLSEQDPAFLEALKEVDKKPYWQGVDEFLKKKLKKEPFTLNAPLFEKIRQGQVWRIFSPAFLHKDLLHLLFNMLWLWILGKPIEKRIRKWRYLLLILSIAAISNLCQYLVSGPNFLGYSGVVMGLVGFIWVRQKTAPWEGYTLQKSVYLFLGAYVFLMLMLSLVTFFSEMMGSNLFSVNIANTAHIVGAVAGAGLAYFCPCFKEQP